jgi:hypothetical protein
VTATTQRLLVVKGSKTGLGDRIRAVLVGALYAEHAQRAMFVDWRDGMYGPAGTNVFEQFFRLQHVDWRREPPADDSLVVAPPAWQGRIAKSMDTVYREDGALPWNRDDAVARYSVDLARADHAEPVVVTWEFTQTDRMRAWLPAPLRGLPTEAIEQWAWRRYLRLAPALEGEVDAFFAGLEGATAGVHVRATLEFEQQKGGIPMRAYHRVLDRLVSVDGVRHLVVATDNQAVLAQLRARYPQVRAINKWFPAAGEPMHLAPQCPDPLAMARDALLEMALLARCDWLVSVQHSSYSVIARLMSAAPASRRITLRPIGTWWQRVRGRAARISQRWRQAKA